MLRLSICDIDLSKRWRRIGNYWCAGRSWIQSFDHPALESFFVSYSDASIFIVREALYDTSLRHSQRINDALNYSDQKTIDYLWAETIDWPLDWTTVRFSECGEVVINSGAFGVAPVYLVLTNNVLRGSWDPIELYSYLPASLFDEERIAYYLACFGQPYSRKTIFSNLFRVTERAQASWTPNSSGGTRFEVRYPDSVEPPKQRALKSNVDPVRAAMRILSDSLSRRLKDPALLISSFLSGGLDSALGAATAATLRTGAVHTYGLIMPGYNGVFQSERRRILAKLFQFHDHPLSASHFPPFAEGCRRMREKRVVPWEECYDEAFDYLLEVAAKRKKSILLQGTGGDELLYPHWEELDKKEQSQRHRDALLNQEDLPAFLTKRTYELYRDSYLSLDRAPLSYLPTSALEDASCGAPPILHHGIWPVHPLCTKELVTFCRSLPYIWRQERALVRQVLSRMGCPRTVTHPNITENFSALMGQGLRRDSRTQIRKVFSEAILADLGFIDRSVLISKYDAYCENNTHEKGAPYYAVAVLELAYRAHSNRVAKDPLSLSVPDNQ